MNLFELATRFQNDADKFARNRNSAGLAGHIRSRLQQINEMTERAKKLELHQRLVAQVETGVRIPKRKLVQRIKSVERLEATIATDVAKIIERDAIDSYAFDETFGEAETAVLNSWRKFARPEREIRIDGLDNTVELAPVAQQLRTTRQMLEAKARDLPSDAKTLKDVAKLKTELAVLTDRILASGYPEDVLSFIAQARQSGGVRLSEILKSPIVRAWLEKKNNAAAFRVTHESVSQPSGLRP